MFIWIRNENTDINRIKILFTLLLKVYVLSKESEKQTIEENK